MYQPVGNSNSSIGQKKIELNHSEKIPVSDQVFFMFVLESPLRLCCLQRSASIGMCSVKNVSWSKKPHSNRMTQIYAAAAHLLKKFNRPKIPPSGAFLSARRKQECYGFGLELQILFSCLKYSKSLTNPTLQHIVQILFS